MRIMGLDIGSKTIGVAISDPLGLTAQGLTTIRRRSREKDLVALKELARQYNITEIVVGLPRNMNGSYGPQAALVKQLASKIEKALGLPLHFYDERLSTVAADRILIEADLSRKNRRRVVDQVAATIILQGFLDRRG
ncbi:MAG: Holliday junction resolvase RuvX [Clostridia bacterium]|nr:Holliday junction resolvase RuvX [Clostridia bacterium]